MEAKYTILPKTCLDIWAESVGISKLPDDVGESLAEDVTYRIREAVNNALHIMKHSKRTYLTVDDFNNALKESNTEPIYGHGGTENLSFKAVSYKDGRVCYVDEKEVNLREVTLESVYPADPGETTVKASWLVLEGYTCTSGRIKEDNKLSCDEPAASYLTNITNALLGKQQHLRKIALKDLLVNKKLQVVLPNLISFFSTQIKLHTGKKMFSQVSRYLLLAINALVENQSLLLAPYVFQLVKMMLFITIEAQIPVSKWSVKNKAAHVLAHLCREHTSTPCNLSSQLLKSYQDSLTGESRPLSYLYGAIVGVKILGIEAVYRVLYPVVREKLKYIVNKSEKATTYEEKMQIVAVKSAFCDAISLLFTRHEFVKTCHYDSLYKEFYEALGEEFLFRCVRMTHEYNYNGKSKFGHCPKLYLPMHLSRSNSVITDLIKKEREKLKTIEQVSILPKDSIVSKSELGNLVSTYKWNKKIAATNLNCFMHGSVEDNKNQPPIKKRKLSTDSFDRIKHSGFHLSFKKDNKLKLIEDILKTPPLLHIM